MADIRLKEAQTKTATADDIAKYLMLRPWEKNNTADEPFHIFIEDAQGRTSMMCGIQYDEKTINNTHNKRIKICLTGAAKTFCCVVAKNVSMNSAT